MISAHRRRRRGVTLVEVLIVMALVAFVLLLAFLALPRSRETARLASCGRNLSQIGQVLAYYDTSVGHLPHIPAPGEKGVGPLAAALGQFGLGSLEDLDKGKSPAAGLQPGTISEHLVPGFLCPSDPYARISGFPAPVSYRANAGSKTDGRDGPFPLGATSKLADAEAAAGKDYIAAFAERLLGSGSHPFTPANDYQVVTGPVGTEPCPLGPPGSERRDAGSSWKQADWASSLYNHALTPNGLPSCVASDGLTARMGTSSGHDRRINVLMLGGSVRGFTPTVDPDVWRKFGAVSVKDR